MSNAKPNKEWRDTADANQDDELSRDELDTGAGGVSRGPEAAADKGRMVGPYATAHKGGSAYFDPDK